MLEEQIQLSNKIGVPYEYLYNRGGTQLNASLGANTYYGAFHKFLLSPQSECDHFRDFLISDEVIEATRFRGKCISLHRRLDISFSEAREIATFEDDISDDEACALVMSNYLSMKALEDPLPVFTQIDQYGRFIIIEGLHRSIINLTNGHELCPVFVINRHAEWLEFIEFFRAEGSRLYRDDLSVYHEIKHPDFSGFKVIREDRSGAIVDYLARLNGPKSGIDIGSMIGFYSHALSRAGHKMTAVEKEPAYASALERLNIWYNQDVKLIRDDIIISGIAGHYDFAIMLSVLYHLLRNDEASAMEIVEILKKTAPILIIDTESRTGILTESKLRSLFEGWNFEKIFSGTDDRDIFAITRP